MIDTDKATAIVDYLNELLELDRPAVAALVANRVPCNEQIADHPTCQVAVQHGGFSVGLLGLLNGLCGVDSSSWGGIAAVFETPDDNPDGYQNLMRFMVRSSKDNDEAPTNEQPKPHAVIPPQGVIVKHDD